MISRETSNVLDTIAVIFQGVSEELDIEENSGEGGITHQIKIGSAEYGVIETGNLVSVGVPKIDEDHPLKTRTDAFMNYLKGAGFEPDENPGSFGGLYSKHIQG